VRISFALGLMAFLLPSPTATPALSAEPPSAAAAFRATVLGIGPAVSSSEIGDRLKKVVHQVELVDPVAPTVPAKSYELVQSLDENGFPVCYSLSFVTHVCNDQQCLPVEVTMTWDALGYYERLTYPPAKPLTKKDHVPFTTEDYAKLDRILRDRGSILAAWTLAFLEKPLEPVEAVADVGGVDAVTAPTPTTVRDSVIEDAAYTSWALWHWANGEIVPILRRLTEERSTPEYLKHLLTSDDRRHADYALEYVIEHSPTDTQFVDDVVHILATGERDQIPQAIEFLEKAIPDRESLYAKLVDACVRMQAADCPIILQKLADEPNLPPAALEALTGKTSELPYFPVHLVLRMLEQRKFASGKTIANVAALLDSDDFFIARRAYEHLSQQKLDAALQARLDAFREENRNRL